MYFHQRKAEPVDVELIYCNVMEMLPMFIESVSVNVDGRRFYDVRRQTIPIIDYPLRK